MECWNAKKWEWSFAEKGEEQQYYLVFTTVEFIESKYGRKKREWDKTEDSEQSGLLGKQQWGKEERNGATWRMMYEN